MGIARVAGAAMAAALLLSGGPRAEGTILTDRLSGRQLKTWRAIAAVVQAVDRNGQPLRPTLYRLFREVDSSAHDVRIQMPRTRGASGIAGRFRIEALGAEGRYEAVITLNLRAIDRLQTGRPGDQLAGFEELGRAERCARVLGHELAHAAWSLADPRRARLVAGVQAESAALAQRARTTGSAGEGFADAVRANERLVRMLEEPALVAETTIAAELRSSR